jgi:hypothetical protein
VRLTVEPAVIALSPGDVVDLLVRVANDGEDVCTPYLAARGIAPDDVLLPDEVVAVAPGAVMTAIVRVRAAADANPGDQRIALAAEDLEGMQRPVSATTLLRVGARPDVAIEVDPVATSGRTSAKATTVLRNRSDRRLQIGLEATGDGVSVRFRPQRIALDPGETRRIRTRVRRTRRSWFSEIRHGAVVTARGIGAPASTTLTFTQRPAIPRVAVRGTAAFLALAVWVAATVVVFERLTAEDPVAEGTVSAVGPVTPGPGRTSATGLFEEPEPDGVRLPVVIQGTIEGPRDPSGTLVTAERISFGDEGTTTGLTKVVALAPVKLPRGAVLDRVQVTTDERGRFRIASGLAQEAFYRVTATRAGFEVASFIVSTSADAPEVSLAFALDPAPGVLAGRVVDSAGAPVGGASILVTDGTLSYRTTTVSEGFAAGTWLVEGVATPSTYQVVVTRLGFASETLIVDIDGGQVLRGVDVTLAPDLGTLRGTVRAVDPGSGELTGIGGIDISLAGPDARTTRTITAPASLRGGFTFPALPFGTYELTFSAAGWATRVTEVVVDRGDVVLDVSDLVRSTGVIQGHVWQVVTGLNTDATDTSQCRYPRISQREEATTLARPCGGVGVSVTDESGNLFATATANGTGFFQVDGVPAGEYTVRISRGGYVDHVERIVLSPGGLRDLTPQHTTLAPQPISLSLRPALAACIGVVELVVLERGRLEPIIVGSIADPRDAFVSGEDPPPGIRVPASFEFECEPGQDPPRWQRVGNNVYRVTNVPLGQTPIEVAFDGFGAEESIFAVTSGDSVRATVLISPEPRDVTGTVRILSAGAGAARDDVRVRLLDASGDVVVGKEATVDVTESVDLGGGALVTEATFTIPRVDVNEQYRLTLDGPGVVAQTGDLFTLTGGGTPFETGRKDLQARTTVTGRVRGFTVSGSTVVPADLAGATLVFTPEGGSALPDVIAAGDGTFSLELDAARYTVTVSADGYATRTFAPGATALIGTAASPTQLLQATTAPFANYPGIAGTAGDVGLIPAPRAVRVDVDLRGAATADRTARVELVSGTIAGVATTQATHASASTAIAVSDATDSGRVTFADVPVGVYTLQVVPTDTAGAGGTAIGVAHTAQTVVVGPDGAVARLDVTTTARAMSRLTGRVVGFDVFTMSLDPLGDVAVTAPQGVDPSVVATTATVAPVGSFDVIVRSGAYGTGGGQDFAAITVDPTLDSRYEPRTVAGTIVDITTTLAEVDGSGGLFVVYPDLTGGSTGDVGVDPAVRSIEVAVDLLGVDGVTERDLEVRLVDGSITFGAEQSLADVALAGAGGASTVTAGTRTTFSSASVLPGTYRVDVRASSGTRVVLDALSSADPATARVRAGTDADAGSWFVDVRAATSTIELTATVQARTVVSGTVLGYDAALDPVGLAGATLTLPAGARATTVDGALPASEVVTITSSSVPGSVGEFSVEVDSGTYGAGGLGGITLVAPGYAERSLAPALADGTATLLVGTGEVRLTPLPRDVTVDLTLAGVTDAQRSVNVRLVGGSLGGAATDPVTVAAADPVTLTVGATTTVAIVAVPVGAFTLEVEGVTENLVTALSESVVVVPGTTTPTTALAISTTPDPLVVQARSTLTVTVTGIQVDGTAEALTTADAPLAGASVTVPGAGDPSPATPVTGPDGEVSVVVDSGVYAAGGSGPITVTAPGYSGTSITGVAATIGEAVASVTVILAPAATTFSASVALEGADDASRTVTVEVCASAGCDGDDDPLVTLSGISASVGSNGVATSVDALPVGIYTFRVSGDDVETTSVARVIGPAGAAYATTAIAVRATVRVSGTVVEGATDGTDADTPRALTTSLVLSGVSVTAAAGAVPAGGDATVTSASDGSFTIVLRSGASADLTFSRTGFTTLERSISVADAATQATGDTTLVRATMAIRVDGTVSDNVTLVVASASGQEDIESTPTGGAGAKRYALDGLATGVSWTLEYSTSDGIVVRRFVQSDAALAIELDQNAEVENVGTVTVNVSVGQDPAQAADQSRQVRVTLSESVPAAFYSLSATGSLAETITVTASGGDLNAPMTGTATFARVPVASASPSLPADRLTLLVEVLNGGVVDTAYRWVTVQGTDGTATIAGFDLTVGATGIAAATTRDITFVRAPGPVTALAAAVRTPDNGIEAGEVSLTWDAPAARGGVAADDLEYVVSFSEAGGPSQAATCSPLTSTTCLVTGLTNGTAYTFSVTARSDSIPSLVSAAATVEATPRTVPDAPTGVSATAGDASVALVWTAPVGTGGSALTGYRVEYRDTDPDGPQGQDTGWRFDETIEDGGATGVTITELTNGTTYWFRVAAVNGAGLGAFSATVSATPVAPPEP